MYVQLTVASYIIRSMTCIHSQNSAPLHLHTLCTQTVKFFIKDKLKAFVLLCLLVPPILAGLVAVIQWGGEYFYIYAWIFIFIISLVHTCTHTILSPCQCVGNYTSGRTVQPGCTVLLY